MADPLSPPPAQPASDTKNATTSLVTGILSLVIPFIGLILGILAIVFWNKQRKIAPNGMATAGLITGILGFVGNLLLVLLMLIGMFAYFGVMDDESFLPDRCVVSPPFTCTEFRAIGEDVTIKLQNNGGVDMNSVQVAVGCGYDAPAGTPINVGPLVNGESAYVSFSCPSSNGRINAQYTIEYVDAGGAAPHTTLGSLQMRVG